MSIFEITGKDIAELKDDELRDLIGLLCEEECRSLSLGTSGIRYGGHQDAKDGGVDVMVDSDFTPPSNSFVARKVTAFQVKKPKMPKKKILSEMKPGGILRPEIMNFIRQKGAYIMVSSGDSVTESTYNKRLEAMKEAIAGEEDSNELYIDFFDQKRVATWVRSHPAMILWVRKKVGREYPGWQPYGNWSNAPGGIQEEYLFDDQARLFDFTKSQCREMSILEGIAVLRQKLSNPGKSIRLTGLSGVGKTRFVQALFDDRIDGSQLNPFSAYYTDISDNPEPDPKLLAGQLVELNQHCILIVDNCLPELHRKLTDTCRGTQISLLTIEYDLRDEDLPEETEVYRLEPASLRIIIQLLSKRYPYISQNDAFAIADFSGGNARIAITLASTIESGETLASLRDEYLFERLFWQKKKKDRTLLHAAEVLSLLYSFEGTETDSGSELYILSSLNEISPAALYRQVGELKARGLLQERSNWRAVLPQAIANRLAQNALKTIPKNLIVSTILDSGNDRVVKSFFHRLSYLHDSPKAAEIITDWIFQNEWYGEKIFSLSDMEVQILQYVTPVCPDRILTILESAADHKTRGKRFTSRDNPKFLQYVKILRHLAYEADTFQRCAALLARFASSEAEGENVNPIRVYFKALFFSTWSGTLASPEVKANFIEELLNSDETAIQNIGVLALEGSLQARNFFPTPEHSFGARPRNFGYHLNRSEVLPWYESFVNLCTSHILSGKPTIHKAKKILAAKIRELWVTVKAIDVIEKSAEEIRKNQSWNEAWIDISEIVEFDRNKMTQHEFERLNALREILKPKDLESLTRAYALSDNHLFWDLERDIINNSQDTKDSSKRIQERTVQIGTLLANDENVLNKLLPEFVATHNTHLHSLGKGIAKGCTDKRALWINVKSEFIDTSDEKRQVALIKGFLNQCSSDSPDIYNEILDEILEDEILGIMYPIFQSSAQIGQYGLKRLYRSLELNKCNIDMYRYVAYNGVHEGIGDDNLAALIEAILKKKNGFLPITEILMIRFTNRKDPSLHSEKLLSTARQTLAVFRYSDIGNNELLDHKLTRIAEVCLREGNYEDSVKVICSNIRRAFSQNYMSCFTIERFMELLLQNHTEIFLDSFLIDLRNSGDYYFSNFHTMFDMEKNPLNKISDDILIKWCEKDPDNRFELISEILQPFVKIDDSSKLAWREIVYYIFENVQELDQILENIAILINLGSWSGSYEDLMKPRLALLEEIKNYSNIKVNSWADNQALSLQREVRHHKELEERINRDSYGSFE